MKETILLCFVFPSFKATSGYNAEKAAACGLNLRLNIERTDATDADSIYGHCYYKEGTRKRSRAFLLARVLLGGFYTCTGCYLMSSFIIV